MEKTEIYSGYEYKEIKGSYEKISFYLDSYQCFGWEVNDSVPAKSNHLHLKRNRNITNRMELTRLQRNFEADLEKIHALEESKRSVARITSAVLIALGIIILACAVFAVTSTPPKYMICALLGTPGILLCILAILVRKPLVRYRTNKVAPILEARYEKLYEICDKAKKLLE